MRHGVHIERKCRPYTTPEYDPEKHHYFVCCDLHNDDGDVIRQGWELDIDDVRVQ